jgi:hypothetical protein
VRRSAQERQELIQAYGRSGLSKAAFCRERGLLPATFYLWFKKQTVPAPRWAEVQVDRPEAIQTPPHHGPPLELALPCGVRMGVRDARWLPDVARLVRALENRPC